MRIGSQNKLAHYQCEYRELTEQTSMLQSQIAPLQAQISNMQQYCNVNNGDRQAMASLRQTISRLNSISSAIRRNTTRLATLERQIANEQQRIMCQQQKAQARLLGYRRY